MPIPIMTRPTRSRAWSRPLLLLAAGAFWLLAGQDAHAQLGLGVEGRAGVTLPLGDLSDAGAESDLSLGAELHVSLQRNLTVYGGFHRNRFSCDNGCTLGSNPQSTGLAAGLKYIFHAPGDILVWGRGGIVADKFETDAGSSDREIGVELGVGGDMPIGSRLYLVPNIGFTSYDTGDDLTVRFFTLGIGVHYHIR